MKYLPDLIRKGAKVTRRTRGCYFESETERACVTGAVGIGLYSLSQMKNRADRPWVKLTEEIDRATPRISGEDLPTEYRKSMRTFESSIQLSTALIRLNDKGMRREEIAAWLEETFPREDLMVEEDPMGMKSEAALREDNKKDA